MPLAYQGSLLCSLTSNNVLQLTVPKFGYGKAGTQQEFDLAMQNCMYFITVLKTGPVMWFGEGNQQ